LGEAIIDEIYYRLLCDERGGELRSLLQQKGKIKRISKAVDYIHPESVTRSAKLTLPHI
jgi:hypothetical protein